MCQLSAEDAYRFMLTQHCDPQHPAVVGELPQHLASGPVVAMELMAVQGVRRWLDILGELPSQLVEEGLIALGAQQCHIEPATTAAPATPALQTSFMQCVPGQSALAIEMQMRSCMCSCLASCVS
jgi:hypothetical protein